MNIDFDYIPHTADIKLRIYGSSMAELFGHALAGMFQSIEPHAPSCTWVNERLICPTLDRTHPIDIHAPDRELLLIDFLSYALYLSDVYNEAYLQASFTICHDTHLQGTIAGVGITGFERVEIKAVTYHDLYVKQFDTHWQAEVIFDI